MPASSVSTITCCTSGHVVFRHAFRRVEYGSCIVVVLMNLSTFWEYSSVQMIDFCRSSQRPPPLPPFFRCLPSLRLGISTPKGHQHQHDANHHRLCRIRSWGVFPVSAPFGEMSCFEGRMGQGRLPDCRRARHEWWVTPSRRNPHRRRLWAWIAVPRWTSCHRCSATFAVSLMQPMEDSKRCPFSFACVFCGIASPSRFPCRVHFNSLH